MLFNGSLRFKGAAPFRWVQRQGDGKVHLVFDHNGAESVLEFSADAWAAIWKAAALLESGAGDKNEDRTTVSNPLQNVNGKGGLTVDFLIISTDDQPIQFKVSDPRGEDLANALPTILMTTPGELVNDKDFSYPRGKDISHKRGKDISHPCGKQISHPPSE